MSKKDKAATALSMPASRQLEDDAAASWVNVVELIPWSKNPRRIPETAVHKIAVSMSKLGFGAPVLARRADKRMIAGHARMLAFRHLLALVDAHGLPGSKSWAEGDPSAPPEWYRTMKPDMVRCLAEQVAPVRLMDVTEEEADLLALADNRLNQEAEWDYEALANVLRGFKDDATRLLSGFDGHELEPLLAAEWRPPELGELPGVGGGSSGDEDKDGLIIKLTTDERAEFETALARGRSLWGAELSEGAVVARISEQFVAAADEAAEGADEVTEVDECTKAAEDFE